MNTANISDPEGNPAGTHTPIGVRFIDADPVVQDLADRACGWINACLPMTGRRDQADQLAVQLQALADEWNSLDGLGQLRSKHRTYLLVDEVREAAEALARQ